MVKCPADVDLLQTLLSPAWLTQPPLSLHLKFHVQVNLAKPIHCTSTTDVFLGPLKSELFPEVGLLQW